MLQRTDTLTYAFRDNQLVAVRRPPAEAMNSILKEGLRRLASHALDQLDAELVGLWGLHNIVVFDGGRHVGTRVPPRKQAVGRLGQCKAWDIVVDIFNGGVVVRSGQEVWGAVRCTGFVLYVECIFEQPEAPSHQPTNRVSGAVHPGQGLVVGPY